MAKKEKITAELTLDVNNFNRRVDDAKKTLQSFGKSTAGKELLGVFGKLAPAIGAVTTAGMAFEKFMSSSQTATDAFGRTLQTTNAVLESFFANLAYGSFDNFLSGLRETITSAREAYDALDALGTANIINTTFFEQKRGELANLKAIIKGKDTTKEARKNAQKEYADIIGQMEKEMNLHAETSANALNKYLTSLIKKNGGSGDVKQALKILTSASSNAENDMWVADYEATIREKAQAHADKYSSEQERIWAYNAEEARLRNNEEYKFRKAISQITDEDLTRVKQIQAEYSRLITMLANLKAESAELLRFSGYDVQKSATDTQKVDSKTWDTVRLKAKYKAPSATDESLRLEPKIDKEATEQEIERTIAYLQQKISNQQTEIQFAKVEDLPELKAGLKELEDELLYMTTPLSTFEEELHDATMSGINSVGGLVTQFTNLGSVLSSDASGIDKLSAGMSAMTGIMQGAMQVANAFNKIQEASIAVDKAKQASASGKAVAEGVATATSSSKHWIELIAALTAVTGAVLGSLSMAKFANGGIVGGNSTAGDSLLVRANTGEMILNTRQQQRLFAMLDGRSAPSANSVGNVNFRISGRDLVGTMQAFNNYQNKGR